MGLPSSLPRPAPTIAALLLPAPSHGPSEADIKKQWRKLALRYHPDKTHGKTSALFSAIQQAHALLSDPIQKALFDAKAKPAEVSAIPPSRPGPSRPRGKDAIWGSFFFFSSTETHPWFFAPRIPAAAPARARLFVCVCVRCCGGEARAAQQPQARASEPGVRHVRSLCRGGLRGGPRGGRERLERHKRRRGWGRRRGAAEAEAQVCAEPTGQGGRREHGRQHGRQRRRQRW